MCVCVASSEASRVRAVAAVSDACRTAISVSSGGSHAVAACDHATVCTAVWNGGGIASHARLGNKCVEDGVAGVACEGCESVDHPLATSVAV